MKYQVENQSPLLLLATDYTTGTDGRMRSDGYSTGRS